MNESLIIFSRERVVLGVCPHEHMADLYRELSDADLTGYEVRVRLQLKNNELYKLGMTKHVMDLHQNGKVRLELQAVLPLQAEESAPEKIRPLRQETDR